MSDPEHLPHARKSPKVIPIISESGSLYEARTKIQPRSISGKFAAWRWIMVWITQIVFYGLP